MLLWDLIGGRLRLLLLVQSLLGPEKSLGWIAVFLYIASSGLAPGFLCRGSSKSIWGLLLNDWYIGTVGENWWLLYLKSVWEHFGLSFHFSHWCWFFIDFSELRDLVLGLILNVASWSGSSTLLLRLSPVTSRSPSFLAILFYIRNCRGADDVRIWNQWCAFDALATLLSGIHWGILSLGGALRAHWVDDTWGNHVVELVMLGTSV